MKICAEKDSLSLSPNSSLNSNDSPRKALLMLTSDGHEEAWQMVMDCMSSTWGEMRRVYRTVPYRTVPHRTVPYRTVPYTLWFYCPLQILQPHLCTHLLVVNKPILQPYSPIGCSAVKKLCKACLIHNTTDDLRISCSVFIISMAFSPLVSLCSGLHCLSGASIWTLLILKMTQTLWAGSCRSSAPPLLRSVPHTPWWPTWQLMDPEDDRFSL